MLHKKLLPVIIVFVALLSGCLQEETPCSFFKLVQKEIYNNTWRVDSLRLFVEDSVTNYYYDTLLINDGSCRFISDYPYTCADSGTMVFTRANGAVIHLRYFIPQPMSYGENNYPGSSICIHSPVSLDGDSAGYATCLCSDISDSKIHIGPDGSYYYCSGSIYPYDPRVKRYWTFALSKN